MAQASLKGMYHWSWTYEDEEESKRQGWGVVYVEDMHAYCPVDSPVMGYVRYTPKNSITVMPTQYRHTQPKTSPEPFTSILENAMCGSPTALKALTAIVTTNPEYSTYQKTLEALTE